jgi:hypothetical protein
MSVIEQVYAAAVLWWIGLDKFPLMSGTTAMVVASLRMRSAGKFVWSEALLCGVFAILATVSLGFLSVLLVMDIPLEVSSGIGGAIGWYGTTRTVEFLESKLGGKSNGSNKE